MAAAPTLDFLSQKARGNAPPRTAMGARKYDRHARFSAQAKLLRRKIGAVHFRAGRQLPGLLKCSQQAGATVSIASASAMSAGRRLHDVRASGGLPAGAVRLARCRAPDRLADVRTGASRAGLSFDPSGRFPGTWHWRTGEGKRGSPPLSRKHSGHLANNAAAIFSPRRPRHGSHPPRSLGNTRAGFLRK